MVPKGCGGLGGFSVGGLPYRSWGCCFTRLEHALGFIGLGSISRSSLKPGEKKLKYNIGSTYCTRSLLSSLPKSLNDSAPGAPSGSWTLVNRLIDYLQRWTS